MPDYAHIRYEVREDSVWVWLNRPERRNASDLQTLAELTDALRRAEEEPSARCAVLTGEGPVFCAGMDLRMAVEQDAEGFRRYMEGVGLLLEAIRRHRLPVVLRANGDGYGLGAVVLGACDVVVAVETARFGLKEVVVGLSAGGTFLWDIGRLRALDLCLTGRSFTAREGERWGLVTRAVPADALDATVEEYLQAFRALPPLAVSANKRTLNALLDAQGWGVYRRLMVEANLALHATEDRREAQRAMLERRTPSFKGR